MNYTEVQPIALAILTSIITGGFVLVFVELGNRKQRENERFDQKITPFMHKLSAYFRFMSWCSHRIIYPKPTEGYNKDFKEFVNYLGRYGGRAITSGGDYPIGHFNAAELEDIALKINNVWYCHDKMNPCMLTWDTNGGTDDFIDKELREINALYYGIQHDVNMVAKVSGDFYVEVYQPVEYDTYKHEASNKQYGIDTKIVAFAFIFVLAVLCTMLFVKMPVAMLQILTTIVILLLILSLALLAVDTTTQMRWCRRFDELWKNIRKKTWRKKEYKLIENKMKRIIRIMMDFFLSKILLLGLLLSAWAILSIEISLIPRIPTYMDSDTIAGLDKICLALAYSYVAGAILYWFTATLPYKRRKKRLKTVIDSKIGAIGEKLSEMNIEFRDLANPTNPEVTDIDAIMALFHTERWTEKCIMPNHQQSNVTGAFIYDYLGLQKQISMLIRDYKEYLSTKQLMLLESIRTTPLDTMKEFGQQNSFQFSEYVYEKVFQPTYRKMLEDYKKLKDTL